MNHYIIIKTLLLYIHNIIISLNFTNYTKFIKKKKRKYLFQIFKSFKKKKEENTLDLQQY